MSYPIALSLPVPRAGCTPFESFDSMTTMLASDLPLPRIGRGKVRDIYAVGDDRVLLLTTDRISAFDVVMAETIPMKGAVLTQISAWWFAQLEGVVHHHMISADADEIIKQVPALRDHRASLAGRAMLCKRTTVFPIECVIRGYISGSAWKEYAAAGHAGGREARRPACWRAPNWSPRSSARRPRPKPATTRTSRSRRMREVLGDEVAYELESMSRAVYTLGEKIAREQGIIIADTKFEFGRDSDGRIILIDEVMTPDSSRFWAADAYTARPAAAEFRQAAAARLSRRRAPRRPLERRRPAAAAAGQRGGRHQQALSRSLSPRHRRRSRDQVDIRLPGGGMTLTVREMTAAETDLIVEYFLSSTPEHLEMLGVDPTRFPPAASWRERLRRECALPIEHRSLVLVIWLSDDQPIGFSTSDKIVYGEQANMHLHVVDPGRRHQGVGAECVRRSVDLYFEQLQAETAVLRAARLQRGAEPHACRRPGSNISRPT